MPALLFHFFLDFFSVFHDGIDFFLRLLKLLEHLLYLLVLHHKFQALLERVIHDHAPFHPIRPYILWTNNKKGFRRRLD